MQPQIPQKTKIRRPILIFLKMVGPPLVLYVDDTEAVYNEILETMLHASDKAPKLIEKTGKGPLKKMAVWDTQIAGVAIQEERYPVQ